MIDTREYSIEELGERKSVIPGPEPKIEGPFLQVCYPYISEKAKVYIADCLDTNWISSRGKYLDRFEREFSAKVGAEHAVAVNSGTSALACAVAALGIGRGDKVVVPTFTMISTVFALSYLGAEPVFVDSDEYYQMDPLKLEQAITNEVKLILPVHIYGHPVDMDRIEEIAKSHNVPVIYDAAEAHGALYKGQPIGGRGLATCYSFYANKIITTGEGGMVVSNNKDFIDVCRNLKDVAFSHERHFWHKRLGYNFRMTNLCAAVGCAQVEVFDDLVQAHIDHANYYKEGLKDVKGIEFAKEAPWAKNVYWMVGIEVKPEFGMTRDELREFLAKKGIETRTYFVPMHLQPYYAEGNKDVVYPVAERLCREGLYIPSSSGLTDEEMDLVISAIKEAKGV